MVSFRSLVAGVALVMAPVVSAITALEFSQGIDTLTAMSTELQGPANSISIASAPLPIPGQDPAAVRLFALSLSGSHAILIHSPLRSGRPNRLPEHYQECQQALGEDEPIPEPHGRRRC